MLNLRTTLTRNGKDVLECHRQLVKRHFCLPQADHLFRERAEKHTHTHTRSQARIP